MLLPAPHQPKIKALRRGAFVLVLASALTALSLASSDGNASAPRSHREARAGSTGGYWLLTSAGAVVPGAGGSLKALEGREAQDPPGAIAAYGPHGYWLVSATGAVEAYGNAPWLGSLLGRHLDSPIVGIAGTSEGAGYWLLGSDGGVFAFGDARFMGSAYSLHLRLRSPFVAIAGLQGGQGYWVATRSGLIVAFGAASHITGTLQHVRLQNVSGIAATPDGRGYWVVSKSGQVVAAGDAKYFGGLHGKVTKRVIGVAPTADGHGYWLATAGGDVVAFGDASRTMQASTLTASSEQDIRGIASWPSSAGARALGPAGKPKGNRIVTSPTTTSNQQMPETTSTEAAQRWSTTASAQGPSTSSSSTTASPTALVGSSALAGSRPSNTEPLPPTTSAPVPAVTATTTTPPVYSTLPTSTSVAATTTVATKTTNAAAATSVPQTTVAGGSAAPTPVCRTSTLESPYTYDGSATTFTSGEYGLPTYGSAASMFPQARAGYIVPAGNDSAVSWPMLNTPGAVIYFEPGDHTGLPQVQPGAGSVYIGGYSPSAGEAEIDGGGGPGNQFISTSPDVTIEYLTVANYDGTSSADSFGGSVVDEYGGYGWTVDYDTVGPNGDKLGQPYTGYGIGVGSASQYEYDCVTGNGEGGFNNGTQAGSLPGAPPWGNGPAGFVIEHDEIAYNAVATGTSSSQWQDMCGCAAGIKVFWSLNGTIDDNYVHDNYGNGIWPDTNNTGMDISGNYIADNFEAGIDYEASFNANITGNVVTGNGWDPKGTSEWAGWPNGYQTSNGGGPGFADGAIYLDNSGGDAGIASGDSRYLGHLYVEGNTLDNNFGGIAAFMDRNRFCGEGPDGGRDACTLNGTYSGGQLPGGGAKGTTYYDQPTSFADDAVVASGSTLLSTASGFSSNYSGQPTEPAAGWVVAAFYTSGPDEGDLVPIFSGSLNGVSGVGTISSCSSNNQCTLSSPALASTSSPGQYDGQAVEIEAGPPGGCGMYDLLGAGPGKVTGSPAEPYWDNCNWAVQDLTVSGNTFEMDANPTTTFAPGEVTNCSQATGCGYMYYATQLGPCTNGCFWSPYTGAALQAWLASGAAADTWSDNTYTWTGPGSWSFEATVLGGAMTAQQWQGPPYDQDAGSTGLMVVSPRCRLMRIGGHAGVRSSRTPIHCFIASELDQDKRPQAPVRQ